uniref:Protein C10 n=1 Tax=Alexandrium catenella TaxID=2925 RepID=A0A7S1WIK4_ALECA
MGRGGGGARKGLGKGKGKALGGKAPGQLGTAAIADRPARALTLEQALSLQEEMLDAFADKAFQKRLRKVEELHGKAHEGTTEAHKELFLEVHSTLLPSYGYPGTSAGVREMLAAASRHNGNEEFWRNRARLNRLLGLEPPSARQGVGEEPEDAADPADRPCEAPETAGALPGRAAGRAGAAAQKPAGRVRVTARHATDGDTLQVMVPETASFQTVKEAISKKVGRGEFLTKGRLVGQDDDGTFFPQKDDGRIGDLREVLVLGYGLQPHEDEEAKAWRHELAQRQRAAADR